MFKIFYYIFKRDRTGRMFYIQENKKKLEEIYYSSIALMSLFGILVSNIINYKPLTNTIIVLYTVLLLIQIIALELIIRNDKLLVKYKHKEEKEAFDMLYKQCEELLDEIQKYIHKMTMMRYACFDLYYTEVERYRDELKIDCEWVVDLEKLRHKILSLLINIKLEYEKQLEKEKKRKKEQANTFEYFFKQAEQNKRQYYHQAPQQPKQVNELTKYLTILELPSNTTNMTIITKQWHTLMIKYHPDKTHDNGEKAKDINEAYQNLKEILG